MWLPFCPWWLNAGEKNDVQSCAELLQAVVGQACQAGFGTLAFPRRPTACRLTCPRLSPAHLLMSPGSVTAFLHENILNFIEEGAVEDAAACLEALSAADCMAAGRRWGSESCCHQLVCCRIARSCAWLPFAAAAGCCAAFPRLLGGAPACRLMVAPAAILVLPLSCLLFLSRAGSEGELFDDDSPSSTLLDAAAASTAARGVCFANAHPAPRRWLPLKAPAVFTVGWRFRQLFLWRCMMAVKHNSVV